MEYGQWPPPGGEDVVGEAPWTAAADWVDPNTSPPPTSDGRGPDGRAPAVRRQPVRRERRRWVPWGLIGWLVMLVFVVTLMNAGVSYIDRVQRAGEIPVPAPAPAATTTP